MNTWRWMAVAAAVTTVAAGAGAWVRSSHGARLTGDEPQYVLTAISLAEDRSLDISDELAAERWRPFHERAQLPEQTELQADGRRVSPHDPLLPAILAAPVALGGWLGARLTMAAVAGLLAAALVWVAIRRLGLRPPVAVLGTVAFTTAPPLASYGAQVYPELPAAAVVVLGFAAVTAPSARRAAVGVVAVASVRPWLSVKYAPVAAALAAVAAWRLWRAGDRRAVAGLVTALGAAAAVFAVLHLAWYGGLTPYAAGDHFTGGELTVAGRHPDVLGRSRRLVGLLVDREFGLVAWQPAWLLAPVALGALARRRPRWWPAVALPLVTGWLTATFVALTMHGWWFPGRQVVVVLPLAVLAVAWWAGRSRLGVPALVGALAVGLSVHAWLVVEGTVDHAPWAVDLHRTLHPLHRVVRAVLPDEAAPAWPDEVLHLCWIAAVTALAVAGWRTALDRSPMEVRT